MEASIASSPEKSSSDLTRVHRAHREYAEDEGLSYTREHLEDSLSMLSEELDALGIRPVLASDEELRSFETLTDVAARLIDASWKLVHKHRSLMRKHEQLSDIHSKISNDNVHLKKRIERSKEELGKKDYALQRGQENERRLKAQCESLTRDLKREKDETVKLRKQSRSKDNQHEHELRRAVQNGYKLRDRLEKSKGSYVSKDRSLETTRSDREDKLDVYRQIILRLEENNRFMLQEIGELKEALSLRSSRIDLRDEKPPA